MTRLTTGTEAVATPVRSTGGLLAAAIGEATRRGRPDLAARLTEEASRLASGPFKVLVTGEFKKGRSSLVNGLVGVEVCGTDPVRWTSTQVWVGYAPTARAELLSSVDPEESVPVEPREVAEHSMRGPGRDGRPPAAIRVGLPRTLLATGLTLCDTPGVGGGFASAQAAVAVQAAALADAALVVSDASQEFTESEVDYLRRIVEVCPTTLCVLTKTDLYPAWRRILDIDRRHLAAAGLRVEIVPVSSRLRRMALADGDAELNAESGFPVLVDRLRTMMADSRAGAAGRAAAAAADAMEQIVGTLETGRRPEDRRAAELGRRQAAGLSGLGARWLTTATDRFGEIAAGSRSDLQDRMLRLEQQAVARVNEIDPTREWDEFVPWLYRRTNEVLTDSHRRTLAAIEEVEAEVARGFAEESGRILATAGGPGGTGAGDTLKVAALTTRAAGRVEVGMQAARGWSLSSSVVTTLLVTTLHPALWVLLPISAVFGTALAVKSVLDQRSARVDQARREGAVAVTNYLRQQHSQAAGHTADLLRRCQARLREYYLDRAAELRESAERRYRAATAPEPAPTPDLAPLRALIDAAHASAARTAGSRP
ncbi:dynamin family protein [Streptomyces sp. TLI_235]|nr:dynamin family protein [Streptomyces sp. TLI_235]PBC75969.1 dynamin family protein [Streptomyces sp. TLI_235]